MKGLHEIPFIIGVYSGQHKPNDFNVLLRAFVNELLSAKKTFTVFSKTLIFENIRFIADLPARTSMCKTKFLGYNGCPSCEIEGTPVGSTVYYPNEKDAPKRTDQSFKLKSDHVHHLPNRTSILEELDIGMIN